MNNEPVDTSLKRSGDGIHYQLPILIEKINFDRLTLAVEKYLFGKMMRTIGDPHIQVVLWNGHVMQSQNGTIAATVFIRDRMALLKLVINPELYFGELYSAQRVEVQGNLLDCLEEIYQNWPLHNQENFVKKRLKKISGAGRNSITGSQHNISHHYDIGNDFYKIWLDDRMLYTCAYFPSPDISLEDGQFAKMQHICRKLNLLSGESVIETGCGWGALALHMAKYYGVTVTAYNISKEQISFARKRAQIEGLDDKVLYIEDDYRNVNGKFDVFVSVGMLEHVGTDHYKDLGAVINRNLKSNGRGLIHSIGLNYPRRMDAWTERHIFPGACPPSLGQMMQIFEPYNFSVLDVENLRMHYVKTLEHWLQRYDYNVDRVAIMFDLEFVRAWRLYLAGSLTAFKCGGMQLFQVSFARANHNDIPWTRQYLYESQQSTLEKFNGAV